jgi:hypothetical protein
MIYKTSNAIMQCMLECWGAAVICLHQVQGKTAYKLNMTTFPIIQHKTFVIQYATFCTLLQRESQETGFGVRGQLKCDGTRAETRFRLSAKRASPIKLAGVSVQSTTGSRGVRISGSKAGYTMFRSSVKGTGYPLHSPVSPSLLLPASPCAMTYQMGSTE